MSLPSLSPRARAALIALAVAAPVCSLASLAGAAWWVNAHGGLAASLAQVARATAAVAGTFASLPDAAEAARFAALDEELSAKLDGLPEPGIWLGVNGAGGGERDFSFALIEPGKGGGFSFVMDGDTRSGELGRLSRSASVPTVWFSRDGVEYVVTDRATVERARELCGPLQEIGSEMGRVGAKQGAIGAKLGRYGGRLGALGGRLGASSARLATVRLSASERNRIEAEMDEVRAEMERLQAEMEAVHTDKAEDHENLSRRMDELSKRHKEALGRAREGLRKLVDEAIRDGRADRLGRST